MVHSWDDIKAKYADVDEFVLKKWDRLFGIFFDLNHSDDLTAADFYVVMRQARNIYGASSEQAKYAREATNKLWEGLKREADTNHDEKISIFEWIDLLKMAEKNPEDPWFNDYQGFMFKLFDVSGDALLDLAEYTDGMHCYGYGEKEAHEAFESFAGKPTAHKPVTIDRATFKKLFDEYFFSKDRAAKGNALFGVLDKGF